VAALTVRPADDPRCRRSDGRVVAHADVHSVGDLFLASGAIPRLTTYETGLAGHHSWRGDQVTLDREIQDERFLAANVRRRGTTVFTACSHAGIVNVGLEARRLLSDGPIDLLLGGYHLAGTTVEDRISPTVRDLASLIEPTIVAPRTLHRLAGRRRARRRVRSRRVCAERRRDALPAQCLNLSDAESHGRRRCRRRSSLEDGARGPSRRVRWRGRRPIQARERARAAPDRRRRCWRHVVASRGLEPTGELPVVVALSFSLGPFGWPAR
jgi:hypothetical protein